MTTITNRLRDYERAILAKKYGRKAKPTLIADKSIPGLIAANCKTKSKLFTFRLLSEMLP